MKNNWPDQTDNVNAALIVAHPDDETIFCGGTLLSYPQWKWHILCVTMQTDTNRPQEFQNAMSLYKNYGVNIDRYLTLEKIDRNHVLSETEINDWKNSVQQLNLSPDIVLTHNNMGEYGHNHHMFLSEIVNGLFSNVWEFVYPGDEKISPQPTKTSIKRIELAEEILKKKRKIFNSCYLSQITDTWNLLPGLMKYEFETGPEIFTSEDKK